MDNLKEYKGEMVKAKLTARLVPPSPQYPDCMCRLLITDRHFYVLEDNFDGTYERMFQLQIRQIKSMKTEVSEEDDNGRGTLVEFLLALIIAVFGGGVAAPSSNRKNGGGVRLAVQYDSGMGKMEQLYFIDLQSGLNSFIKAYVKAEKAAVWKLKFIVYIQRKCYDMGI